jgi:hypothetical protein
VSNLSNIGIHNPVGNSLQRVEDCVGSKNCSAYNLTRRCVLGVEIDCGDFTFASLSDRMPMLTAKSGTGLWMVPFKGMPETGALIPLDLIYLDADHRVIETVEFYPTFRVSPSSPPAASVLALPAHSIFSSHTQPNDQLIFGRAEEIEHRLNRLSNSTDSANETAVVRDEPPPSSVNAPPLQVRPKQEATAPPQASEVAPAEPWKKSSKPKSWLQKLLSPEPEEPRKALRMELPGLCVYFWTGGVPVPHAIRDISSTGLYVITEERWYPGTKIQMTLKKTDPQKPGADVSISVLVKVNRWGNDGVGLGFEVQDSRDSRRGQNTDSAGVNREQLDRFLEQIGHSTD